MCNSANLLNKSVIYLQKELKRVRQEDKKPGMCSIPHRGPSTPQHHSSLRRNTEVTPEPNQHHSLPPAGHSSPSLSPLVRGAPAASAHPWAQGSLCAELRLGSLGLPQVTSRCPTAGEEKAPGQECAGSNSLCFGRTTY